MRLILFLAAMCSFNLFFSNVYALHFPNPPSQPNFYVDQANLIQPEVKKMINEMAGKLWQERNIPFFVVSIPSLITQGANHYTVQAYASALFNSWGIGSKNKSYGILLVISKAERIASIILGAGWGNAFELQKENIIKEMLIPHFDQGQFSNGIVKGVVELNAMTFGKEIPKQSQLFNPLLPSSIPANSSSPIFKLLLFCSVILIIVSFLNSKKRRHPSNRSNAFKKD